MKGARVVLLLTSVITGGLFSCSSDSTTPASKDGGTASDGAMATDGPSPPSDAGSDSSAMPMAAPVLKGVVKMTGVLHVSWENVTPNCDAVEAERKTSTAAYAVAFSVAGTINNKMDMSATQDTAYTYRLRCKMGMGYSDYSNEMSGNPVR